MHGLKVTGDPAVKSDYEGYAAGYGPGYEAGYEGYAAGYKAGYKAGYTDPQRPSEAPWAEKQWL